MINKNWVSWCWHLGVFCAVVAGAIASSFECAQAQSKIVPDSTLGVESSVVLPYNGLPIEVINGGAIRGGNLFHSFLEFNVSSGRGVYFFSPNVNIQNILARVTGSNRSEILGTLGTYGNSNPNLFLINPNGIIFGANASLDVGGSFVATTANAVLLGNNGIFSASEPAKSNLLSVNPSALLFNAISGQGIVNRSQAPAGVDPNGDPITGLRVPNGRSLLLVGGDVQLDGGNLFVQDGRVELGGVSGTGTVGLNVDGNYLSLSFPQQVQLADVSVINGSLIQVPASDGSSAGINASNQDILDGINITARSVALTNGALLTTGTSGRGNVGSITINASDRVSLDGVDSQGNPSGVFTSVLEGAFGKGGNINITTGSLALTNLAQLVTATYGQGNAGSITINAGDRVSLDGKSSIFSNLSSNAVGNGGDINITTGSLTVRNGATVETNTAAVGNAGSITINARDTVKLDGVSSDGSLPSSVSSGALLLPDNYTLGQGSVGSGGNINITAGSLQVTNGALLYTLDTNTLAQGNAGSITINARDTVTFDHSNAFSRVIEGAVGTGGDINITTGSLALTKGTQLNTTTFGLAKAGNVTINARDTVTFDGTADSTDGNRYSSGVISAVNSKAVGRGGNINITTGSLTLTNGAQLNASTDGQGDAGNVTINARDAVTFDGTDGNAGNVGSSGAFSQVNSTGVGKGGTIGGQPGYAQNRTRCKVL